MMEMCGDNRFEIIDKARKALLEGTNINASEDEMKVLDRSLSRCWQMGWLDKYDEQADKYRWHIIGECPDELPKFDTDLEVVNDEGIHHIAQLTNRGAWGTEWRIKYCLYDTDTWCEDENGTIIAWRYIEPFEGGDTE